MTILLRGPGLPPLLARVGAALLLAAAPSRAAGDSAPAQPAPVAAPPQILSTTAPWRAPRDERWDAWGEARLRVYGAAPLATDDQGTALAQSSWLASRLLAGGRWVPSSIVRLDVELEWLTGYLAGDPNPLGTAYTPRPFPLAQDGKDRFRLVPRKANVAITTPVGQLVVGAQAFNWGTGMLVNDGSGAAQLDGLQFGDAWMGNVVGRVAFLTRPLQRSGGPLEDLAVFVAADVVLRDDNANVFDGDLALAGVAGARIENQRRALGALVSGRHQVDRADPYRPGGARSVTDVAVVDVFGRGRMALGPSRSLTAEGELAVVAGRTTRPLTTETVADGAAVLQLGGLARLRYEDEAWGLLASLEGGYAAGDNDPRDATARAFTMHSDHNVGLLLFERVLPAVSARAVDRLADPALAGTPPASARFLVNPGAVQNAVYAHPVVRWRPLAALDVRVGYVFAVAAGAVSDAYLSGIAGGYPTAPAGSPWGHEVDARVAWTQPLPADLRLVIGVEGGILFPGAALASVQDLGRPWLVRGLASLRW